ncbi:leucyl aminopeptidase family protein [Actibacterium ureilyticum]|uniref:leucyl aminopeptidase family protein n=1 Tax=Actibacterium ureilyticum TaxID=1590614 RepID=UPI000BAB17EF|nr:leucyl aminopeptidase family protein [Actibacterium ureilyticum]
MPPKFAAADAESIPVHVVGADGLQPFLDGLDPSARTWLEATGFRGDLGQVQPIPGADGALGAVAAGFGTPQTRARGRFHLAQAAQGLPAGTYHLQSDLTGDELTAEALGWLLAGYRFDRYKPANGKDVRLKPPAGVDAARLEAIAQGECLTRDLINTPAADMGPQALEQAARDLAARFGADIDVCTGDALLDRNFPMIHAVGRAAAQAPRLIDMRWGGSGPRLTLVGKGVCFDTGGLNLKPGASMGLMKKDMGGAATVLGLAQMIMALDLPVRLRVLIPAVENSVSATSFRPQDILTSRKGLTVEVNNTDAEGRLVLADALALADEEPADLIVSMATLTGAARVAVGPDIAPFYTDQDGVAAALGAAAAQVADPVWRMPFHAPYEKMIEPGIADLDNAPSGGFAGSITAALFLRRFVDNPAYAHFDIYGWQPAAAPARPKGGVGQGARALLQALPQVLAL